MNYAVFNSLITSSLYLYILFDITFGIAWNRIYMFLYKGYNIMVKYYVNESGVYKIVKFTQTEYYIIIESFEQLISTPNVQSIPAEHVDNEKYFFDSETVARQHYMIFIELHYRMLLYQRNTLVEKVENLVYNEVQKQISALLHFNID